MLDLNAELESANIRILQIQKAIILQAQVLRHLSDRGLDKTLGERMLEFRRYYLRRATAHAGLIAYRIATRSQLDKISECSEKAAELENNLA